MAPWVSWSCKWKDYLLIYVLRCYLSHLWFDLIWHIITALLHVYLVPSSFMHITTIRRIHIIKLAKLNWHITWVRLTIVDTNQHWLHMNRGNKLVINMVSALDSYMIQFMITSGWIYFSCQATNTCWTTFKTQSSTVSENHNLQHCCQLYIYIYSLKKTMLKQHIWSLKNLTLIKKSSPTHFFTS